MRIGIKFQAGALFVLLMLLLLTACGDETSGSPTANIPAASPSAIPATTASTQTTAPSKTNPPTTIAPPQTTTPSKTTPPTTRATNVPIATPTRPASSWDKQRLIAEQQWLAAKLENYRIVIEQQTGMTGPTTYDITVRNRVVATEKNTCNNPQKGNCQTSFAGYGTGSEKLPVEILFQRSNANIRMLGDPQKPVYINLDFDGKYGYPEIVYVSPLYVTDSQLSFKVKSFEVL